MRGLDTFLYQAQGGSPQMSPKWESKPCTWTHSLLEMKTQRRQDPVCHMKPQVRDLCSETNRLLEVTAVAGKSNFCSSLFLFNYSEDNWVETLEAVLTALLSPLGPAEAVRAAPSLQLSRSWAAEQAEICQPLCREASLICQPLFPWRCKQVLIRGHLLSVERNTYSSLAPLNWNKNTH